jgi:acyl-coenzyme A synthetase/AMP-(fatty) acid ligase
VLTESEIVTFAELFRLVTALSKELQQQGIGPGAGVALQAPNGLAFIVGLMSLARCEAVVMPIPAGLTEQELEELRSDIPVEALLRIGSGAMPPALSHYPLSFDFSLLRFTELGLARRPFVSHVPDAALIRPTSGTTGKSKGVVLSHRSVLERLDATQQNLALTPGDRIIWVLPMAYHFISSLLLYLKVGAGIVIARDHLATSISEAAHRHGGTVLFGSPSIYASLAELPPQLTLPHFRHPISTSGALSSQISARFRARHGFSPRQVFGIIEVGLPLGHLAELAAPAGALGYALPPYEIEITDDLGQACPPGTPGNLWVKGPGMFDAYLFPAQRRDEVTRDGFFSTGDLAIKHSDGSYEIAGRKKASINYAGVKVFPEEVEEVVKQFAGIKQCRVYGEPHAQLGEIVVCDIELLAGASLVEPELRRHCRKLLSTQKIPQQFRVTTAIPLTHSGKVRRW